MTANIFDFNNTDDLPKELGNKLKTEKLDRSAPFVEVLRMAADQNVGPLDLNQITAAYVRLGNEAPVNSTLRGYINSAVEAGLVVKPSRQTYAIAPAGTVAPPADETADNTIVGDVQPAKTEGDLSTAEADAAAEAAAAEANDDPLADL